jgi:hypothetical protein
VEEVSCCVDQRARMDDCVGGIWRCGRYADTCYRTKGDHDTFGINQLAKDVRQFSDGPTNSDGTDYWAV